MLFLEKVVLKEYFDKNELIKIMALKMRWPLSVFESSEILFAVTALG